MNSFALLRTTLACATLWFVIAAQIACAHQSTSSAQNKPALNTAEFHVTKVIKVKEEAEVIYGMAGNTKLTLDAYTPDDPTVKHPAILLIHGGGWSGGDKRFYAPMGRALAAKGYVAFSINYRLLTQAANKYPAQLDDSQRAVRWVRAHANSYNIDPARIGALGDSAGGYLVAMLGTRDTRDNSDAALASFSSRIQCGIDFYGPTDFTGPLTEATANPIGAAIVANFLGKKAGEAVDLYKESSPVTYVDKNSAPFLIIHGTTDPLVPVSQSEHLYEALHTAGIPATLLLVYKQGHGFLNPGMPTSFGAVTEEFFARILKP